MVKFYIKTGSSWEFLTEESPRNADRYVVPLPFPDPNLMFPNNKKHAIQRLMGLKRGFIKDNKFFQDYLSFMDNLLRSSCAKRSDASLAGKIWYIPHHGVYHPSKIRVVFDCNAEFQGTSINKELLSGPDLTNHIIGVLTRFRQEKIAFMADVMCAHVFGATSSASCSNYALRRTAVENEAVFGETAANAFHHNFYVDDLLKSMEDLDLAKKTYERCHQYVQVWWLPSYRIYLQ